MAMYPMSIHVQQTSNATIDKDKTLLQMLHTCSELVSLQTTQCCWLKLNSSAASGSPVLHRTPAPHDSGVPHLSAPPAQASYTSSLKEA